MTRAWSWRRVTATVVIGVALALALGWNATSQYAGAHRSDYAAQP